MKLHSLNTGLFKLDGGAMFGVVPKSIWQKLNPADENNLCNWAMRCLLIEVGERLILIDTGCGNKQDEKFFSHYYLNHDSSLEKAINQTGFQFSDITDVILTHLHFDHVGGATIWNKERTKAVPTFPNAKYWVSKKQLDWAKNPNAREKPSFMSENFMPLIETGQLNFIDKNQDFGAQELSFLIVNGHTESMLIPKINLNGKTICFMADLIPSVAHIPLPYIASYDIRPLEAMKEKEAFLMEAYKNEYLLFFEHDPANEMSDLKLTEKGIRYGNKGQLSDFI